jgi:hypothetical protein
MKDIETTQRPQLLLEPTYEPTPLPACSICLRVLVAGSWIEADELIRSLRTFESPKAPRFSHGLCDLCANTRRERRDNPNLSLAA